MALPVAAGRFGTDVFVDNLVVEATLGTAEVSAAGDRGPPGRFSMLTGASAAPTVVAARWQPSWQLLMRRT